MTASAPSNVSPAPADRPESDLSAEDIDSVGLVETRTETVFDAESPLRLRSGKTLAPVTVAYETYGDLNEAGDNAVFVCQTLTSDAHAAGRHAPDDKRPGWWDGLIGPGKALDTTEFFVVCANALGGCRGTTGPNSIDPVTGKPYGPEFPFVTIGDIVDVHRALCDRLGVKHLRCIIGGSLGGMQALEWAAAAPEEISSCVVLASGPLLTPQGIAFNAVARRAIFADVDFRDGHYYDDQGGPDAGLALARMIAHITYVSEQSIDQKFGRGLQDGEELSYDLLKEAEFQVESYLHYQGKRFVERFDANSYLNLTRAMDYFDLADAHGPIRECLGRSDIRFLIGSYSTDWLFPPSQSEDIARELIGAGRDVTYAAFESPFGHDAFLLETTELSDLLRPFLENTKLLRPWAAS